MIPAKIIKNFITDEEKNILNNWTLQNYTKPYFSDPRMNNDSKQTRFTTRHPYNRINSYRDYKVNYPDVAYKIQQRLFSYLNVDYRSIIPWPSFTDGIVNTIAFSPGGCIEHIDPVYYTGTYTLHCNFITNKAISGGITQIQRKCYDLDENDMLMYITSHIKHGATDIIGDDPRILWVYGFCIHENEVKTIFNLDSINFTNKFKIEYK